MLKIWEQKSFRDSEFFVNILLHIIIFFLLRQKRVDKMIMDKLINKYLK